jgi:hypothetical protein
MPLAWDALCAAVHFKQETVFIVRPIEVRAATFEITCSLIAAAVARMPAMLTSAPSGSHAHIGYRYTFFAALHNVSLLTVALMVAQPAQTVRAAVLM